MRRALVVGLLVLLLLPFANALPNLQWGDQDGRYWRTQDMVIVQQGTRYTLVGAPANPDIWFYSASGAFLNPPGVSCGNEVGTVPWGAAYGLVMFWQSVVATQCTDTGDRYLPPAAAFVYIDGY